MTIPATEWEVVIGLEVHCQLKTASKLFSACPLQIGAEPNRQTDAYSWGLPGTLPAPNRAAIRAAVALGLATHCRLNLRSRFARKHYFYPDLPKGYQITQADEPYAVEGYVDIPPRENGDEAVRVRLHRIHLEEDAGKNIHHGQYSLVDYNRAGVPLVEIVSEPDLRSAEQAAAYLRELRTIVRALGISQANMEEGTLRCDANVSLRPRGSDTLGTRCEIKNVNSFRFLAKAIEAEVRRQRDLLDRGQEIIRSTLGYDGENDRLWVMRSKEDAADYRYMPDPDLPPLVLDPEFVQEIARGLPELPEARRSRWTEHGVARDDAFLLAAERELSDYFDGVLQHCGAALAKRAANWVIVEVLGRANTQGSSIATVPVTPAHVAELVVMIEQGKISGRTAKDVLDKVWQGEGGPTEIVAREGLEQVSDEGALRALVEQLVSANPKQAQQLRDGKDALRGFFVGQVMKQTRGQANPQLVAQLLNEVLGLHG